MGNALTAVANRHFADEHDGTLVLVEVRARASGVFGTAADSVTDQKKRQVVRVAAEYLARECASDVPCRFDVVTIDDALSDRPEIEVYPWAFDATD